MLWYMSPFMAPAAVRGNVASCLQWKEKRTVGGRGQHRA